MVTRELIDVLDDIPDTGEIVVRHYIPAGGEKDLLLQAWHNANDDAAAALEHWRALRSAEAFTVFRAAEDRADAAQDALAAR
jgi:hypothetical protein